jgi:hypothetical protein
MGHRSDDGGIRMPSYPPPAQRNWMMLASVDTQPEELAENMCRWHLRGSALRTSGRCSASWCRRSPPLITGSTRSRWMVPCHRLKIGKDTDLFSRHTLAASQAASIAQASSLYCTRPAKCFLVLIQPPRRERNLQPEGPGQIDTRQFAGEAGGHNP